MKIAELNAHTQLSNNIDDVLEDILVSTICESVVELQTAYLTESDYSQIDENIVTDIFQKLKSKVQRFFKRFKGHTREQLAKIRTDIAILINPDSPESVTDGDIAKYVATSPDIHDAIIRIVKNMKFGGVGGLGKVIVELVVLHPKLREHFAEFLKNMLTNALTADEVRELALKSPRLTAPEGGDTKMALPHSPFGDL